MGNTPSSESPKDPQSADTTEELALQLCSACQHGSIDSIKSLLGTSGLNIEARSCYGETALNVAARTGNVEVAELLLDSGASVNSTNKSGNFPLIIAAKEGKLDIVKLMLSRGANINSQNAFGDTPILAAAYNDRWGMVAYLLEMGASVDLNSSFLLTNVAREGYIAAVQNLLDRGVPVNLEANKCTPLLAAASHGHLDVAKLLVARGANVNLRLHTSSLTPIEAAGMCCFYPIMEMLMEHGAKIEIEAFHQALQFSVTQKGFEYAENLLRACPQIAKRSQTLSKVIRQHNPKTIKIMQLLLELGTDVNYVDNSTLYTDFQRERIKSALHEAVFQRDASKVWVLVTHGANTSVPYLKQTVWELCGGDKDVLEALKHYWKPQSHQYHPRQVRAAIYCALLVAKRQSWPFDRQVLFKILSCVAYGWYK